MSATGASASHSAAVIPRLVSIRMSSGASKRKLMPRSASSSWGDDTPRSSRTPSTRVHTPLRQRLRKIRERRMHQLETGILHCLPGMPPPPDRDQKRSTAPSAPTGPESPAMPAAPEGAIHVDTVRLDGQRLDCLFSSTVMCAASLTAAGFPSPRHEIGAQGEDRLLLLLPAGIRPEFEMVALPHQPCTCFSSRRKLRSSGAISTRPAESISSSRAKPTRRRLSRADCVFEAGPRQAPCCGSAPRPERGRSEGSDEDGP
jgi:hypothetical protein